MRYQILFLAVFLVVCAIQCSASSSTTRRPKKDDGWSYADNYDRTDDDEYEIEDRSYEGKPYYRDNGRGKYNDKYRGDYDDKYRGDDDDVDSYRGDDDDDDDKYRKNYKKKPKQPKDMGHMNIYFNEPSKHGKRKHPKRFRFPVARYERENFPRSFGPLISFMPWIPMFADRRTKQTICWSPTGGVYILPPLINFYGDLFSVAELIASGFASLVSSGVPPPPAVDVAPLVQPGPVVGPGVPAISPKTGGFTGGVSTQFRSVPRPKYPNEYASMPRSGGDGYSQPKVGY